MPEQFKLEQRSVYISRGGELSLTTDMLCQNMAQSSFYAFKKCTENNSLFGRQATGTIHLI